jgi:hypothetical protein
MSTAWAFNVPATAATRSIRSKAWRLPGSITLRDFVGKFAGLARSNKRKDVLAAAGLTGATLRDLVDGKDLDMAAVQKLVRAMQRESRPVKPQALGVIGEEHLARCLARDHGVDPESVRYKKAAGESLGLPFVLEVAFGVKAQAGGRDLIAGLNWSPALGLPFPELWELLGEMRLDQHDPVTLLVHLACPRLVFTDHGKSRVDLTPALREALRKCVRSVAKGWKKEKRQADREDRLDEQRLERQRKAKQARLLSIKDAAYKVMEEAYLNASGNKAHPANARQVMYSARRQVLELTGGKCWSQSSYFTQTLLPRFIDAHPELTADWDVVYDDRGHLIEPHTNKRIGLGTLQVRDYIRGWTPRCPERPSGVTIPTRSPTHGPANRYRFALFVEKEGFHPVLERNRIADRYDVAIMSTKGMSTTAARELVNRLSQQGVTVLVLRDFDAAGFSIVHTLRTDSPRYRFRSKPNVIDIGLRLADVREWGLEPLAEPVAYRNAKKDPRERLRAAGATEEECDFLVSRQEGAGWSGRRVELNTLTSPRFIEFLEKKFQEAGVAKVVPAGEDLASAYRYAHAVARIKEAIRAAAQGADDGLPAMPEDLAAQLAQAIEGTDESWDEALLEIVRAMRG